jgi:hypothetical protein
MRAHTRTVLQGPVRDVLSGSLRMVLLGALGVFDKVISRSWDGTDVYVVSGWIYLCVIISSSMLGLLLKWMQVILPKNEGALVPSLRSLQLYISGT